MWTILGAPDNRPVIFELLNYTSDHFGDLTGYPASAFTSTRTSFRRLQSRRLLSLKLVQCVSILSVTLVIHNCESFSDPRETCFKIIFFKCLNRRPGVLVLKCLLCTGGGARLGAGAARGAGRAAGRGAANIDCYVSTNTAVKPTGPRSRAP